MIVASGVFRLFDAGIICRWSEATKEKITVDLRA